MWKKALVMLLAGLLALSLAACVREGDSSSDGASQGSSSTAQTANTLDVETAAQALLDGADFDDELAPIAERMLTSQYTDLDTADVVTFKLYVSASASGDELAVFEAKDADAAARIEASVRSRLTRLIEDYSDYAPEKVPKLEKPVLQVRGNYVVLCVSNDNAKAEQILAGQWK